MNKYYDEIIISSGGSKGISIIGGLNEINKHYPIKNFKYYTGCSIGAFISLMLIINYTLDELNDIVLKINFEIFQDLKISNFFDKCGLDEGKKVTNLFKAIITNKNYDANITFKELYDMTGKILTFVTVNITKGVPEYHNVYNTPDMPILLSLRMSTNIPVVFSPISYNDNYYVDGAILDPYPYFYIKNTKKLGLWLVEKDEFNFLKNYDVEFINIIDNSFTYIMKLMSIIYINYMKTYYKKIPKSTIYIDFNYSNVTFDMNNDIRIKMYQIGVKKCRSFFNKVHKNIRKKYLYRKYFNIWKK